MPKLPVFGPRAWRSGHEYSPVAHGCNRERYPGVCLAAHAVIRPDIVWWRLRPKYSDCGRAGGRAHRTAAPAILTERFAQATGHSSSCESGLRFSLCHYRPCSACRPSPAVLYNLPAPSRGLVRHGIVPSE